MKTPLPETLQAPLTDFLESLRARRASPTTVSIRENSLQIFCRWLLATGLSDVRDVTRQNVRDYQEWLLGKYAVASTHVHLISLRRFFERLESLDAIFANPTEGVPLPHKEDRLPRNVLTQEEARKVLDAPDTQTSKGIRDKAILEAFYSTGIRLEEMARLTVHDVDCKNGFLRVNGGKGAKDRIVPMGNKAADYVREYLGKVRSVWTRENRDERALWLSTRAPHPPIQRQIIAVMVRQSAKAAGLEKTVSPHVWRHTCATHLIANGSEAAYVQRLLGHRSLRTTQVYTRVSIPDIKQTYAKAGPAPRQKQAPLPSARRFRPRYAYKKPGSPPTREAAEF